MNTSEKCLCGLHTKVCECPEEVRHAYARFNSSKDVAERANRVLAKDRLLLEEAVKRSIKKRNDDDEEGFTYPYLDDYT